MCRCCGGGARPKDALHALDPALRGRLSAAPPGLGLAAVNPHRPIVRAHLRAVSAPERGLSLMTPAKPGQE